MGGVPLRARLRDTGYAVGLGYGQLTNSLPTIYQHLCAHLETRYQANA